MSARSRTIVVVAALALGAAAAAVGGALVQGRDTGSEVHGLTETRAEALPEPPALELAVTAPGPVAERLRAGERAYEEGDLEGAVDAFAAVVEDDPENLEAVVGAAVAEDPLTASERLRVVVRENPSSAVARLNFGLALLAEGDVEGARREWRQAERREPDSPAALRAEDLLNPRSPPGRPTFQSPIVVSPRLVAELAAGSDRPIAAARRAARDGDPRELLRIGLAYQTLGRRVSARGAFEEAARAAPRDLAARTAAALARFEKDDPAAAFSRLGPIASENPDAAVVRLHLGLALLWLPDLQGARRQLELARAADERGFYGREAARILRGLADVE